MKRFLTIDNCRDAAIDMVRKRSLAYGSQVKVYGVPRGGLAAALIAAQYTHWTLVECPEDADIIFDDLVDSGATRARYETNYPGKRFYALFDKQTDPSLCGVWLVFPWEVSDTDHDSSAEDAVRRLLQFVGEDANREGLRDTPRRVLKAFSDEWCSGYGKDPADVLKCFSDGAEGTDELVVMRDIPVYSMCEHHLAPFFGTAIVGYIPDKRIVGLSKLVRVTDIFARRLQVQERMTNQIADALVEHLGPKGVGVILECRHLCMESRGVRAPGAATMTSALRGALLDKPEARAEFLALRQKG